MHAHSGLDFAKNLLVSRAAETITPLEVPDIERSVSIPVIGTVDMVASGIVLNGVAVANSTVAVGDDGIVMAASLSSVNLTMEWSYSYSAWVITISDSGAEVTRRSLSPHTAAGRTRPRAAAAAPGWWQPWGGVKPGMKEPRRCSLSLSRVAIGRIWAKGSGVGPRVEEPCGVSLFP
ncbi:hypothetical protein E2562_005789 [Oryza meyeriana var. granulata]|uniref:Lipid-binding serum glycoprotein N-terminal domain-containing protein n=1 Tax=Oryza meyeriana var. granulata TaxID=110450 RepID=A0A6G1F4R6_9ORYZ|nr:hypothetical protein E2562_005789 [Oryza meyeriana var. granulata]